MNLVSNFVTVRHVAPTMVSSAGGDRITVFGSDFDSVKTIFLAFGRRTIVDTMRITSSLLRATAPAMDVGRKTIAVGGNRFDWEKHNETMAVVMPFHVYSIKPTVTSLQGGTVVQVFGVNFVETARFECRFAQQWTNATFISLSELACTAPSRGEPALVSVHVTSDDYIATEQTHFDFEYRFGAVIFGASPSSGTGWTSARRRQTRSRLPRSSASPICGSCAHSARAAACSRATSPSTRSR